MLQDQGIEAWSGGANECLRSHFSGEILSSSHPHRGMAHLTPPFTPVLTIALGGLVPRLDSAVVGGLSLTSIDLSDSRAHGPRMRIDDLPAPSRRFVTRISALVDTGVGRLDRALC